MGIHVKWPFDAADRQLSRLRGRRLAALDRSGLSGRFHSWFGASGRRYICSVFAAGDEGLSGLDLTHAAVIAVQRTPAGDCRALSLVRTSLPLNLQRGTGNWLAGRSPTEFHVHLLARDCAERNAVLADLDRGFAQAR
ncbi:MAG: hypothetical protein NVSMB26_25500 [Beijerinckiaceae bacterium]